MNLRTPVVALTSAIVLAACSPDSALAPSKTVVRPSFTVSTSESPRYILLVNKGAAANEVAARVQGLGGTLESYHEGAGLAVVSGLSEADATQLGASGLGTLQADFQVGLDAPLGAQQPDAVEVATDVAQSQTNPAAAARFAFQWNMRLIKAPAAWAAGKLGSSSVRVAIIDTGIDYDAADLNGLVDLSRSKSFMNHFVGRADDPTTPQDEYLPIVPSDSAIIAVNFPTRNQITDLNGHGTNVAAQVSSKGIALAGVTSRTTLFGVKVLGANGSGSFSDVLNGVLWAADHDADVANMSLGGVNGVLWAADHDADVANMSLGGAFRRAGNGQAIALINRVFNYARQKRMLIVVAAGNDGADLQHIGNVYPTYCDAPHVICVSSVGPRLASELGTSLEDTPAFYSNSGRSTVDIAAPGGNGDAANGFPPTRWPWSAPAPFPFTGNDRFSLIWGFCAKQRLLIQKNADGVHGDMSLTSCILGNKILPFIGTSQATPHVTGLAALLVAENGKANPERIKSIIQRSADPVDPAYGRGRINVQKALGL